MVRRGARGGQVWSMEKLDNKLVDMRDMYDDWRRRQQRGEQQPEEVNMNITKKLISHFPLKKYKPSL